MNTEQDEPCYRHTPKATDAPEHFLRHRHDRDCRDGACRGCVPCLTDRHGDPTRHCPACRGGRSDHLQPGQHVCPRCVGRVRADLEAVLDCAAAMPEEAQYDGIESEAFDLAGPVADLASWHRRNLLHLAAGLSPTLLDRDETDPYFVLATWERELRLELGHDEYVATSATLSGSVHYLDQQLTDLAHHRDRWVLIPALRADATRVRTHLEAVLHDSRGPERGAPCPACAERMGADPDDPDSPEIARAPRLELKRADSDITGASDSWVCPRCDAAWAEADYRLRVTDDYLAHASALTADQMHQQWRIKPSTLRTWVQRGAVAKRGTDDSGRVLYDVAQAKAARDSRESA